MTPDDNSAALGRAVATLEPGDHVCCWYDDDATRDRAVTGYVADGLRHHRKVVYVTGTVTVPGVLAGLSRAGIPTTAWESGQVRVLTAAETYLAGGAFDPEAMVDGWTHEIAAAREEGYRGLWAMGDIAWAGSAMPGADRLAPYEASVNRVFADGRASALCLYDNRTVSPTRRRELVAVHPASLDAGRADRWTPLLRMTRIPGGLRLVGEIDRSNRNAVAALLEQLCVETPFDEPVTVDVTGLRFVDAATGRLFARAAAARPGGISLAGASPLLARLTDPGGYGR